MNQAATDGDHLGGALSARTATLSLPTLSG